MRLRDGVPLVGIDTDAECTGFACDLDQGPVTGLATCTEHHVRTLVQSLTGRCCSPLGVGERYIETTRVVCLDYLDAGVDVLCTVDEALTKCNNRRDQVGSENLGNHA
ncbi:MAG: hypothetical protein MAG471_01032 [Acidimicrobiaceae bacterium]|nr:hypothetical protein [Acidimicrobiaceae bacterium]